MKYQTKMKTFEACQYVGPGKPFELEGVNLKSNEGTSGYARKLAYILHPLKGPIVVRPMDYVMVIDDEVMVMPPSAFEKSYEPLKEIKKSGKRKVVEDNAEKASALNL